MHAVELVNQFLIYAILWLTFMPVTYILASKNKSSLLDMLIFTIGSVVLSSLLIMFTYTLLVSGGVVTLLASINPVLANILIIFIIMLAPVLVIAGHYKLEHYNNGNSKEDS